MPNQKAGLEVEDGLLFLIKREKNEILAKGLLIPNVGEVLKKFEGGSKKSPKKQKNFLLLRQSVISHQSSNDLIAR